MFEQLFKAEWAYKKYHAFLLGLLYTILGVVSARLVFRSSSGIMSVAFTSILLIPSLAELLRIEANQALRSYDFSLKRLWNDHSDIFAVYMFLFLGIFVAYSFTTLLIPQADVGQLFTAQLNAAGLRGFAVVDAQLVSIVLNNVLIFVVSFLLSLIYGAGAVIFLVWNASVWGVVFSLFVRKAALAGGVDPVVAYAQDLLPFLPHMVTEGAAYVGAAMVGGIVSKAVLREKPFTKRFNYVLLDALAFLVLGIILVVVAGVIEVKWFAGL
ncbi:MAG TPA: stage II sporulation protein M [Candidatus Nanoarchaeia archaeon]|nr:stage II sporulation protein M [Candidatus Nanoarchaeia archaeon]